MFEIQRSYAVAADEIARRIPGILEGRGVEPAFSEWMLTQSPAGLVWLFGVLDVSRIERLEPYVTDAILHHLSTAIGGRPVYLSNHSGLRYAVLMSPAPRLPRLAEFSGFQRGVAGLGIGAIGGPVTVPWGQMGHLLVAGMTGSGKSVFLRLLGYQAILEGCSLLVSDVDGATFPMLEHHPALMAPIAHTPEEALALIQRAVGECDARAALYREMPGYPEKLEEYNALATAAGLAPLPRILVILDEFNATVTAAGGPKGALANAAADLGWRGRKFGINLIFAAQDFSKAVVGRVRDQVGAVFGFRVRSSEIAQAIGIPAAARIPASRPGLAVTDRWGPLQTFLLDKQLLVELAGENAVGGALTEAEQDLVQWALHERGGYLPREAIASKLGVGEKAARKLAEEWDLRGWLQKDPMAGNARKITAVLQALAVQPASRSNPVQGSPTPVQPGAEAGLL
jgi:hypothetical protein